MLHWRSPYGMQLKGMKLAKELDDISPLIQPLPHVSVWDGCARVLYEMSDEILEPHLIKLMEWIQDLNWPGATIILDRLKIFSGEKLKMPFLQSVENAMNPKNDEGFKWIDNLSELLENEELKKELPKDLLKILQKHYHNPGWWYE